MLNGLSLFSGIGGLDVALSEWVRPIAYCEIDPYCQAVLLSRMASQDIERCPIWDDIRTLDTRKWGSSVDIIYGGFPCQDISIAGLGKGLEGERSGLFFEIIRISNEVRPKFIFLENVPAITTRGGIEVVKEIAKMGYDCRWITITASSMGALQKRERWFLLAKSNSERREERPSKGIQSKRETIFNEESCNNKLSSMECWGAFARSMRKDHAIPHRMDRIKALGNAVLPWQAREAFQILSGIKQNA